MRLQTSASLFIAALLTSAIVVGCDSTGSSSEEPPPDEEGTVSFSLVRTANSDVPSDADSAFVRVWRPSGNFNLVEFVNIPDPGQQTEVSLDVPAEQGYRAGVLAVTIADGNFPLESKEPLAHGSSGTFTVQSNDTSQVSLDVRAADLTLEAPESIPPNVTDTIRAVYGLNPPGIGARLNATQGSNSSFGYFDGSGLNDLGEQTTDTTTSRRFEISGPNVNSEDTTYVKVRVFPVEIATWTTSNRKLAGSIFPSSESGPSFEIPVVPGSGDDDGTIIITFSRDGDGWERTRRVFE